MLRVVLAVAMAVAGVLAGPSAAQAEGCLAVGMDGVSAECVWSYSDYQSSSGSGDGHTWVVSIQCDNGGICTEYVECVEGGQEGYVHDVYMDGSDVGDVCVPQNAVQQVDLAMLIIREFKRIAWPSSKLVVQPRGGRTLVNFETNFYTPDHRSIDQSVTVAGQSVVIRAVPVSYTYYFGDDDSTTTASPGSPHPDLEITHAYARTGDVVVRVDTTYSGEYRIGQGEWTSIPDTLTVEGAGQDLGIVEALPQLVLE
ncbi:hypothetical protein IEZ26_01615 [Nocardioides cavernae]|uniref:PKD domain-containing protein n=1 Tax=Nocardioides cavernae TaxID=1921566 RepID=A0ABR8N565_9ACTN|nr:hypothetical protein [Nocardioides cavernae]MBD3923304.1 hypothetical protein [Nocardioides cavernae]MBM7511774.1 hypothetical protein [Nocardioides cavernae]